MKTRRAWILIAVTLAASCDSGADNAPTKGSEGPSSKPAAPSASGAGAGDLAKAASAASPSATTRAPAPSAAPRAPDRPLYYDRPIADEDLKERTLLEFSLLRNTIYARAGNKFRNPWLASYFNAQPWYKPLDAMDQSKITATDRENARKIADADAALTREELERRQSEVLARKSAGKEAPEDVVELSLLSQRLGTWLGGEAKPLEARTPLEDPSQLDRLLRVEDLSTLSRRDLRMLRNMVYARRGRRFDSPVVREYFKTATWYRPDSEYHDGRLTEIDAKNIQIIKSIETSLGGPLHENPNYGKDGWFHMA